MAAPPSENSTSFQLLIFLRIAKRVLFFDSIISFRSDCRMDSALGSVHNSTL